MVRFAGYAKKREPRWPYVGLAFIILMATAVVLFVFSAVTQWLEAEANKPVATTTTTTTVAATSSTTTLAPTTTTLAPAQKSQVPVPAAVPVGGIKVDQLVITSGVTANQPVNDLSKVAASEHGNIYCYMRLSNAGSAQAVKHVWVSPGGKAVAQIELTAHKGASATWSYINITGQRAGQWQVRVETKDGAVLAQKGFVTY